MRRQGGEDLLAGRVVGDFDAKTGGGEIKTVLVEERLAGRLQCDQQRGTQEQRERGDTTERFCALRRPQKDRQPAAEWSMQSQCKIPLSFQNSARSFGTRNSMTLHPD